MSQNSGDEFAPPDGGDNPQRRHRRWYVDFKTALEVDGKRLACAVYDLSPGGACVAPDGEPDLPAGQQVYFELPGYGLIPAEVRYFLDGYIGLMFLLSDEDEVDLAQYLVMVEQNRPVQAQQSSTDAFFVASGNQATCVIEDISRVGARILVDDARHVMVGQNVALDISGHQRIDAQVQRVEENEISLLFLTELEEDPDMSVQSDGSSG